MLLLLRTLLAAVRAVVRPENSVARAVSAQRSPPSGASVAVCHSSQLLAVGEDRTALRHSCKWIAGRGRLDPCFSSSERSSPPSAPSSALVPRSSSRTSRSASSSPCSSEPRLGPGFAASTASSGLSSFASGPAGARASSSSSPKPSSPGIVPASASSGAGDRVDETGLRSRRTRSAEIPAAAIPWFWGAAAATIGAAGREREFGVTAAVEGCRNRLHVNEGDGEPPAPRGRVVPADRRRARAVRAATWVGRAPRGEERSGSPTPWIRTAGLTSWRARVSATRQRTLAPRIATGVAGRARPRPSRSKPLPAVGTRT